MLKWSRRLYGFIICLVCILLAPSYAASADPQSFDSCRITSSKPGWNTVGFPIQQGFSGRTFERLPFSGKVKALIVPVDFPNYPGRSNIEEYSQLMSKPTRDYFWHISYGKVDFEFTVLPQYTTMSRKAEDYGLGTWSKGDSSAFFREALERASRKFEIGGFDVAYVVGSPETDLNAILPGPALIEPSNINGRTVPRGSTAGAFRYPVDPFRWMVHETGHLFGFVDLYNVAGLSAGSTDEEAHQPFGWWDIMSMNWKSFALEMNSWFRLQAGWLSSDDVLCLTNKGLTEVALSPLSSKTGLRSVVIPISFEKVLVAEFRTPTEYDTFEGRKELAGLIVYSVDGGSPAHAAPMKILRKSGQELAVPPLPRIALQVGEYVLDNGYLIGVTAKSENELKLIVSSSVDKQDFLNQLSKLKEEAESEAKRREKEIAEKRAEQIRTAVARRSFYRDEGCHASGISAVLQVLRDGVWIDHIAAAGWDIDEKCPAAGRPIFQYKPWAIVELPSRTVYRWKFDAPGWKDSRTSGLSISPMTLADEAKAAKPVRKKKTITCLRGMVVKKVTAVSPKCPSGFKKR